VATIFAYVITVFLISLNSTCVAQSTTQEDQSPDIKKATTHLLIVDPEGEPVEGATAKAYAFRSNAFANAHFLWSEDKMGPPPSAQSDAEGKITTEYAAQLNERTPVSTISWTVSHPQFAQQTVHLDVAANPGKIEMKRGFRIAASAIDAESGEQVTKDLFAILSSVNASGWTMKNKFLTSPVFGEQQNGLRLVHLPESGPTQFSKLLEVPTGDGKSSIFMKDCELRPGVRVEGRISDDVPRPIKNGVVNACVVNQPENTDLASSWMWFEKAEINEDGTFVFESLPQGEILQMVPLCNGWIPTNPSEETAKAFFGRKGRVGDHASYPQLVRLEGETVTSILEMRPCASLNVTILGPDGKPVQGAQIYTSPNQVFFNMGSQILGEGGSTRDYLIQLRDNPDQTPPTPRPGNSVRFQPKSDQDGKLVLPIVHLSTEIQLAHESLELPKDDEGLIQSAAIKMGESMDVTFRLVEKTNKK
jgi:hypothetical protein